MTIIFCVEHGVYHGPPCQRCGANSCNGVGGDIHSNLTTFWQGGSSGAGLAASVLFGDRAAAKGRALVAALAIAQN